MHCDSRASILKWIFLLSFSGARQSLSKVHGGGFSPSWTFDDDRGRELNYKAKDVAMGFKLQTLCTDIHALNNGVIIKWSRVGSLTSKILTHLIEKIGENKISFHFNNTVSLLKVLRLSRKWWQCCAVVLLQQTLKQRSVRDGDKLLWAIRNVVFITIFSSLRPWQQTKGLHL